MLQCLTKYKIFIHNIFELSRIKKKTNSQKLNIFFPIQIIIIFGSQTGNSKFFIFLIYTHTHIQNQKKKKIEIFIYLLHIQTSGKKIFNNEKQIFKISIEAFFCINFRFLTAFLYIYKI